METNKKLDKIEMKEKNEVYEKEKEKRQSSLEQLLKVKERELNNSIQVIQQKKKKKSNLEKILEKNVDMTQINDMYNKIKNAENEIQKLEKEKENLEVIKNAHANCQRKQQNIIKEIEDVREELRIIQLENKNNKKNEDRKYIYNNNIIKKEEQKPKSTKRKKNIYINVNKSSELPQMLQLPLIYNYQAKINKTIEDDRLLSKSEITEYLKKFEEI